MSCLSSTNTAYGSGVYGSIGAGSYGDFTKPSLSVSKPDGTHVGTYPQAQTLNPAIVGTPNHANNNFQGDFNGVENCACVPINQCLSADIVSQGSSGREIIAGTGTPNYGQVGYGIDPRNKKSGIESNLTAEDNAARNVRSSVNTEGDVDTSSESSHPAENPEASTASSSRRKRQADENAAKGDGSSEPVSCTTYFVSHSAGLTKPSLNASLTRNKLTTVRNY